MKKGFFFTLLISIKFCLIAQSSPEDYGKKIYDFILENNSSIEDEFVELNQYAAYIDRLAKLPQEERELIKANASQSYTEVRKMYNKECTRILKLYKKNRSKDVLFTFNSCSYNPSKSFPDIGLLTCFYTADIPEEEETLIDAIVFECIKTANGWRILDGFFDAPEIN